MQISRKEKKLSTFFLYFSNLDQNLNILRKKIILITYIFLKLWTSKDVLR